MEPDRTASAAGITGLLAAMRPLVSFAWRMLATLTICRTVFVAFQWDSIQVAGRLGPIYADGVIFDTALVCLVLILPLAAFPLLASNRFLVGAWRALFAGCLPLVLTIIVLLACATPSFVNPLDGRPALIFLEYLNDPAGVARSTWQQSGIAIVTAAVLGLALTLVNARRLAAIVARIRPVAFLPALAGMIVLLGPWMATFGFLADSVAAEVGQRPATAADIVVAAYNEADERGSRVVIPAPSR